MEQATNPKLERRRSLADRFGNLPRELEEQSLEVLVVDEFFRERIIKLLGIITVGQCAQINEQRLLRIGIKSSVVTDMIERYRKLAQEGTVALPSDRTINEEEGEEENIVDPTPEEIAERCLKVQEEWTEPIRELRSVHGKRREPFDLYNNVQREPKRTAPKGRYY